MQNYNNITTLSKNECHEPQHINAQISSSSLAPSSASASRCLKLPKQPRFHFHERLGYYYFRRLIPRDRAIIQILHEQWFPVKYNDEFYDALVHNKLAGTNDSLYSCVVVQQYLPERYVSLCSIVSENSNERNETASQTMDLHDEYSNKNMMDNEGCQQTCTSNMNDLEKGNVNPQHCNNSVVLNGSNTSSSSASIENERILGCIVGSYVRASQSSQETRPLLISNPQSHPLMFYIMTLGTLSETRNCGIGSDLVQKCIKIVERNKQCGVVYLHVITYNDVAIRFYERLGFRKMKEIKGEFKLIDEYISFIISKAIFILLFLTICVFIW